MSDNNLDRLSPFKGLEDTLERLAKAIDFPMPAVTSNHYDPVYSFLRGALPYCMQDGQLLNRNYAPLVFTVHSGSHVSHRLCERDQEFLSSKLAGLYFFDDGSAPWLNTASLRKYRLKLEQLRIASKFYELPA